jgi:hypothetical protein
MSASKESPEFRYNRIKEEILRTSWLLAIGEANCMEDDKILPLNSRHEKLEEIRFKVDIIVGDNANVRVKLFKLLRRTTDRKVTDPADSSRYLFVLFDHTQFLKKTRNELIDRHLKCNWELIDLFLIK